MADIFTVVLLAVGVWIVADYKHARTARMGRTGGAGGRRADAPAAASA